MKTKTIPFDLETAKKIQAGEIEGKIVMVSNTLPETHCKLLSTESRVVDYKGFPHPLIVEYQKHNGVFEYDSFMENGESIISYRHKLALEIEVPDNDPQFKPFDKVLVREVNDGRWMADYFSHMKDDKRYMCVGGVWAYCIQYEGNEHLVGTTDKPKEE